MSDKMRIGLFCGKKKLSPVQEDLIKMGTWLSERGHSIVLFALEDRPAVKLGRAMGLEVVELKRNPREFSFNTALKFRKVLKRSKVNLMMFNDYRDARFLVTEKYLRKGKLRLIFIQNKPLHEMKLDFLHSFRFNQIDAWITPLTATSNEVRTGTNLDGRKIHVIPRPVNLRSFNKLRKKKKKFKKHNDIPKGLFVLGCQISGSSIPTDLNQVIYSVSNSEKLKDKTFLLVSVKTEKVKNGISAIEKIEKMFVEAGIIGMAVHNRNDKKAAKTLRVCDTVFLIPNLEPFAGVGSLAVAAGIPAIAPKTFITSEILNNGEIGVLYNRDNTVELMELLEKLNTDGELRSQLQDAGSKALRPEVDKKQFTDRLEAIASALPARDKALM